MSVESQPSYPKTKVTLTPFSSFSSFENIRQSVVRWVDRSILYSFRVFREKLPALEGKWCRISKKNRKTSDWSYVCCKGTRKVQMENIHSIFQRSVNYVTIYNLYLIRCDAPVVIFGKINSNNNKKKNKTN